MYTAPEPKLSKFAPLQLLAPSLRPTLQISSAPRRQWNEFRLQSNINQRLFYKGGGSGRSRRVLPVPRPRPALPPHVNATAITHL